MNTEFILGKEFSASQLTWPALAGCHTHNTGHSRSKAENNSLWGEIHSWYRHGIQITSEIRNQDRAERLSQSPWHLKGPFGVNTPNLRGLYSTRHKRTHQHKVPKENRYRIKCKHIWRELQSFIGKRAGFPFSGMCGYLEQPQNTKHSYQLQGIVWRDTRTPTRHRTQWHMGSLHPRVTEH